MKTTTEGAEMESPLGEEARTTAPPRMGNPDRSRYLAEEGLESTTWNTIIILTVFGILAFQILLKHLDSALGGTLSAFELMWNNFYRLVTTPPALNSPPMSQDYPYYVLIEAIGSDAAQA